MPGQYMNRLGWLETFNHDLKYAFRQLRRNPIFTVVVVSTLALGIGGTTAMFSVVQGVLLAPLPYQEPAELVRIYQQQPRDPSTRYYLTGPHFKEVRDHAASFETVAALNTYSETGRDLVKDGQGQRLRVLEVTSDYFRTLGSDVLRGPGFGLEDEGGSGRVVLSDRLWRTRFHGESIVGSTIYLSAEPFEVVGVAAAGLEDPVIGEVDAWLPYDLVGNTSEQNYSLTAVGRLRTGVSLEQAQAELTALSQSTRTRWPETRNSAIVVLPLQQDLVASARRPLYILFMAVGLVLLVACVNVANLVLVRATGRIQEFAIRSALGSGVRRLAGQLLVESMLLAALGGLVGLALAWLGIDALRSLGRDAIPRLGDVTFHPQAIVFATAITSLTAIVFGLAPAIRLARIAPNQALLHLSRSASSSRPQVRIRGALAAAQLAFALILLVGAAALLASFHRLRQVDLGFRVERVLTFELNLPTVRYDAGRRGAFYEELARRLRGIPGVAAAGGTSRLPATGNYHPWGTRILTGPRAGTWISRGLGFNIQQRVVSGDLVAALEIPVLAGRTFDERDDERAPARALVSANFARHAFPGMPLESVVGHRIAPLNQRREIIGVVGDVTLDVYGESALVVYHAHRQFARNRNWALSQVVATEIPPERILPAVRAAVADLDPELVVYRTMPMTDVVGRSVSRERFALVLMGAFAAVSLMLAALGLYGVLAYTVRQRTQEIGIRIALGATATQVRGLVLRQAACVLGAGVVAGIAGALVIGRWLSLLLFEVRPSDPRVLVATASVLVLTGLAAAWLPAVRASRVEPRNAIHEG